MALTETLPAAESVAIAAADPKALSHYLRCEGVDLSFPRMSTDNLSFRRLLVRALRGERSPHAPLERPVLRDISFIARPGDRIGLVGANGAGKTTLLRLLMGAYEPRRGLVERQGQTASLINTTLGMDLYLSGYDNIRLVGQHMGLTRRQIAEITPDIEQFTELGPALNEPLRAYSSGMLARLAFSIATAARAQIYLMDEWIGAGDARFFGRANARMRDLIDDRAILVLATHSDALIQQWCNRVLVMDNGRIVLDTDPEQGLREKNRLLLG